MFRLNPDHDPIELASRYAVKSRMQIRDIFEQQTADDIFETLRTQTPWGMCFNAGERVVELGPEQVAGLSVAEQQRISQQIGEGARKGYQFHYHYFPLLASYFDPTVAEMPLFRVFEFINSPPFMDFFRTLTGHHEALWADAHATLYRAGSFLKYHTDEVPAHRRVAAYVLNFTPGWGRDWGGFLQFFGPDYDVEQAYRPLFNAMNIFSVPSDHSVSMVSNYVVNHRISITGWLREDEPPRPIGDRTAFGALASGRLG
ncbi:MAG: 2OG-Fe(II) oxygenase [Pseudomonadota bacterium]|nr:2OG-Fe(II) oxygenase [Pseudomonadota bacterium]